MKLFVYFNGKKISFESWKELKYYKLVTEIKFAKTTKFTCMQSRQFHINVYHSRHKITYTY